MERRRKMGQLEKKIEVIEKYIGSVASTWDTYSYEEIPKRKAVNACCEYAKGITWQDIIGMVDITVTGNGKKGMVFTESEVFYNNGFLENSGSITYKSIRKTKKIPGGIFSTYYNKEVLITMLSELANLEGVTLQSGIDGLNNSLTAWSQEMQNASDTIDETTQNITQTIEAFGKLVDSIGKLFGDDEE